MPASRHEPPDPPLDPERRARTGRPAGARSSTVRVLGGDDRTVHVRIAGDRIRS
ncbi:hypothetical protein [Streptomyces sp. NPDC052042]|uniref:hypothetical protein n=1 Tax=Streptomyces sp. NPDC052042 TaxID=3365683 RepID=UPI0037CD5386